MSFKINSFYCFALFWIVVLPFNLFGQNPTIQDCLGAIPVCEQVYQEQVVPDGFGLYEGEVDNDITCLFDDSRAIWYSFTVNSSGDFGFLLSPNDPNDDYDWALYNLTNARCEDIKRDPGLLVSCNAAGSAPGDNPNCNGLTGATGQSNFSIQGGGCGNPSGLVDLTTGNNPFNDLIPVVRGNTYALIVSNFSQSTSGYEIDFGFSGDIGILDVIPPEVRSIVADVDADCSPAYLDITFTESINCSSIGAQNFTLSDTQGKEYPITLSSTDCDVGAPLSKEFRINIMDVLPIGSYNLSAGPTTFLKMVDPCDNGSGAFNFPIEVVANALSDINLPTDTLLCDIPSLTLDVFDPEAETYLWQDGSSLSTLTISQSGIYTIEVSNPCDVRTAEINVEILNDRMIVVDLKNDTSLCLGQSLLIDPSLSNDLTYRWSDGSDEAVRTVSTTGVYELTVSDACGELGSDDIDVEFKDIPIEVNLGVSTFFCTGEEVVLDGSSANVTEYLWSDGSTEPTLSVGEIGTYTVSASNECSSDMDEVIVNESACIDCNIYIPNTMSFTSVSGNDKFGVVSNCPFISYSIDVFDRWGGLMYSSTDVSQMWDGMINGKSVISGAYPYRARISYIEFDVIVEEDYKGTVTVIR